MIAACGAWGCALTAGLLLFPPSGLEAASARLGALSESSAEPFSQQGGKLTGSNEIGAGFFGYTVALSADGTTALVGGFADDAGKGAAWVFTRSGSTWNQQGPKLTGGGEIGAGAFGSSVALSADGTTALIGGTYDDNSGAAWVFTRAGSTWSQQGGKLTGSGEARGGFGSSVALSGDGATALIGASNGKGAAWAFGYAGSTWSRQGKLTGRGGVGSGALGSSVALSADGETALIGGQNDGANQGAAWVFGRSGSTWSPQGGKLTGRGETGKGQFGSGLALSADGGTALIGGLWDDNSKGAAWLFCRSGSTWNRQGSKLTGRGETIHSEFGFSVALSADGSTALIAGPGNHPGTSSTYDGAVWVFTQPRRRLLARRRHLDAGTAAREDRRGPVRRRGCALRRRQDRPDRQPGRSGGPGVHDHSAGDLRRPPAGRICRTSELDLQTGLSTLQAGFPGRDRQSGRQELLESHRRRRRGLLLVEHNRRRSAPRDRASRTSHRESVALDRQASRPQRRQAFQRPGSVESRDGNLQRVRVDLAIPQDASRGVSERAHRGRHGVSQRTPRRFSCCRHEVGDEHEAMNVITATTQPGIAHKPNHDR